MKTYLKYCLVLVLVLIVFFAFIVNSGYTAQLIGFEIFEADITSIDDIDYIPMTNVAQTIESREVRIGDEFMGLTLTGFMRRLQAPGGGGRWAREAMSADLSGSLTISGSLHGSSDENFWFPGWGNIVYYSFAVSASNLELIPFPDNDFRISFRGFHLNSDYSYFMRSINEIHELLEQGGLSTEITGEITTGGIRSIWIQDVTLTLDGFSVNTNAGFTGARITEIKSIGAVHLTRISGGGSVNFAYVTRRNQQERNLERLTAGDEFNGLTVVGAGSQFTTMNHIFSRYREASINFTGEKTFMADIVLGRDIPIPQRHLYGEHLHLVVHSSYHELFPIFPGNDTLINAEEVFIRINNPGEFSSLLESANISETRNLNIKINSLEMELYSGYSASIVEVQDFTDALLE
jgi:hypothetical protein